MLRNANCRRLPLASAIFAATLNYFSHYYFDHIPSEPNHNFGLSLPDFVRNFIKGKKLKPEHIPLFEDPQFRLLAEGTHKHFERDHRFHNSAYFKQSENDLKAILLPVFKELKIGRYWFAAHVLSEMMIDRVLMKQHPEMLNRFYLDLQNSDGSTINTFLNACGIEDVETFETRFERFQSSQYLRQYVYDEAMVYSLNRIFIYTGAGEEWDKNQYSVLKDTIPQVENTIFESMDRLMADMT